MTSVLVREVVEFETDEEEQSGPEAAKAHFYSVQRVMTLPWGIPSHSSIHLALDTLVDMICWVGTVPRGHCMQRLQCLRSPFMF